MKMLIKRRNYSVFVKLLITFIFLIIFIYSFSYSIISIARETLQQEICNKNYSQLQTYVNSFDDDLMSVVKSQFELSVDPDLITYTKSFEQGFNYEKLLFMKFIVKSLSSIKNTSQYVNEVILYVPSSDLLFSAKQMGLENSAHFKYKNIPDFKKDNISPFILFSENIDILIPQYSYNIQTTEDELRHFLYVEISKDSICNQLKQFSSFNEGDAMLVDANKNWHIASSNNASFLLDNLQPTEAFDQTNFKRIRINGNNYIVQKIKIQILNAYLVAWFPEKAILQSLHSLSSLVYIFSGVIFIIMLFYSLFMYINIAKPLKMLSEAFNQLKNGDMNTKLLHTRQDSFGYVFDDFNSMASKIKSLIEEVYEQKILTQRAELRQLQYQINPHFLYNSLFQIYMMARRNDYENIINFSNYLSQYYRFITKANVYEIPFQQEYEHTKNYINIQSIRFQNRIVVELDEVPAGCEFFMVPRLIIQPLVENAYEHGLKKIEENGLIRVKLWSENQYLFVSVENNGNYIQDKNIEMIQEIIQSMNTESMNIDYTGIFNVHKRLQIRFGQDSGVNVERSELGGLKITLYIFLNNNLNDSSS